MLMKKLELENFRQYIGKQTLEMSVDPEKNVTLILGKNTSGKTTIIHAFRWVLYNNCNFTGKKDEPKAVLNSDVRKSMRPGDVEEAKVVLTFVHKGMTYEISRRYEYHCKVPGDGYLDTQYPASLYYYPNGERELMRGGEANLESILPESLAEYFFFDGEKIAQSRKADNVKESINNIMGLVPLQHMVEHLSKGRSCVYNDLRNSLKSDSGVEILNRKIDRVNKDLAEATKNRDEAHDFYMTQVTKAENLRIEMEKIKDIAEAAKELKDVDHKINLAKERISRVESDIIRSFANAMYEAMANYISMDILDNISKNEYEDKGIPGIDATAVHYLLEHGKCICGADLASSESCRKELKELLTYLPPESIGTQISHLRKNLENSEIASGKQDVFKSYNDNYASQLENLETLELRFEDLTDKVKDHRNADTIMEEYESARKLRDQFQANEVRYQGVIQNLQRELTTLQKDLAAAARADTYNQEILTKMDYVEALFNKASKTLDESSKGIFKDVQKTLTGVFNSMYHGSRTIELTENYKVGLTVGGEHLDNSKGLDTVQNFAFIASLLKVARDRSNLDVNSEPYPLAMDAVFSNTDEGHIRNICKTLPQLAEQAILALMDKDWAIAASSLEGHVGKKYRINKISETHSEIREVTEED